MDRRTFVKMAGATVGAFAFGGVTGLIRSAKAQLIPDLPGIIDPLFTAPVADPAAIPQFINPLPVIKDLGLRIDATDPDVTHTVAMAPTTQSLLGTGLPDTPVWGYSVDGGQATYPGATFIAESEAPVNVQWVNNLGFDYLLKQGADPGKDVVDTTLHWAFGKVPGTFAADGIPAVAHLHGGHSDPEYDGLPEQWFTQTGLTGDHYVTDSYEYDNSQEAATLWYHDHALGITRQNVYAGLAGFYLLRDDNELALINSEAIPGGDYEIEMVIQDRMFYPDGRLAYPDAAMAGVQPSAQPEFFGQVILVNGKAWPVLSVEPRQYRLRMLNGSDSRFYNLWITGPGFLVIGNDTGLLNAPVPVNQLTIGPGERYDVVVDFSRFASTRIIMRNNARVPFPKGATVNPRLDGRIMAFNVLPVATGPGPIAPLTRTTNLRPLSGPLPVPSPAGLPVRKLMLFEATDHFGRLQPLLGTIGGNFIGTPAGTNDPDGTLLWDDTITEDPELNATEVWEVFNATVDAHPIHLHLVHFQILDRQKFSADVIPKENPNSHIGITQGGKLTNIRLRGKPKPPEAYEAGLKDTAIMYPGEVTRIIARFDKPGRYVWHCHILSHEDHEMMRPYRIGA